MNKQNAKHCRSNTPNTWIELLGKWASMDKLSCTVPLNVWSKQTKSGDYLIFYQQRQQQQLEQKRGSIS